MQIGIVGLPNVGKSTLFNSITDAGAECANYPFCTIQPNVGMVAVPDERLDVLAKMYSPEKVVPAIIEFVDIAGLVRGASKGEGLGNKFLSHIREVDAIAHVVRCFEDQNIAHVDGLIDPIRDIETINLELIFSDLEIIEKHIDRVGKMLKSGDKKYIAQLELYKRIRDNLEKEIPIRAMTFNDEEQQLVRQLCLITSKPVLYVANVSESDMTVQGGNNDFTELVKKHAASENSEFMIICAKIEEEISQLDGDMKREFIDELGLEESGLNKLIKASYKLLGLISFLTAGPQEVRAWTIKRDTKAPQAAGKIHSDFEKGFIRAEVVSYDDLIRCGSHVAARENGLVVSQGKNYVIQDGDVVLFRFNV